jgi:hypothetical protein
MVVGSSRAIATLIFLWKRQIKMAIEVGNPSSKESVTTTASPILSLTTLTSPKMNGVEIASIYLR